MTLRDQLARLWRMRKRPSRAAYLAWQSGAPDARALIDTTWTIRRMREGALNLAGMDIWREQHRLLMLGPDMRCRFYRTVWPWQDEVVRSMYRRLQSVPPIPTPTIRTIDAGAPVVWAKYQGGKPLSA